jgi:hypothetical protein
LYSREDLPSVVWVVIYARLLIGFSYFFGLEAFPSQALMCAIFSNLLGLTLVAILELAHPYQGAVTVSDQPFKYALMRMDDMDKVALGVLRTTGKWQVQRCFSASLGTNQANRELGDLSRTADN